VAKSKKICRGGKVVKSYASSRTANRKRTIPRPVTSLAWAMAMCYVRVRVYLHLHVLNMLHVCVSMQANYKYNHSWPPVATRQRTMQRTMHNAQCTTHNAARSQNFFHLHWRWRWRPFNKKGHLTIIIKVECKYEYVITIVHFIILLPWYIFIFITYDDIRLPARSPRQVPLLRGDILVVSSKPLQIAQRDFGVRFLCV
jgi:hypothetical protein